MWSYRCYDDGKPGCPWQRWYDENPDFQGSHDSVFDTLEGLNNWGPPEADILDKDNRIIEVRLSGKVKHRLLGFYGGTRYEFVIVGFCYHKQRNYYPPAIKNTVVKRKRAIENDAKRAKSCTRPQQARKV